MQACAINYIAVFCANFFNILITGIMLARPKRLDRIEWILGIVSITLVLPLSIVVRFYAINQANFWMVVLPSLLIAFLVFEFILDYLLKFDFRKTRWLGLYLLLFYAAQWGMIGFGFLVNRVSGFITLLTYLLSFAATAYSYTKVGHGKKS